MGDGDTFKSSSYHILPMEIGHMKNTQPLTKINSHSQFLIELHWSAQSRWGLVYCRFLVFLLRIYKRKPILNSKRGNKIRKPLKKTTFCLKVRKLCVKLCTNKIGATLLSYSDLIILRNQDGSWCIIVFRSEIFNIYFLGNSLDFFLRN